MGAGTAAEAAGRVDPPPADGPTTIRLAVLSDYDGVTWRVGATYRTAGRVLPAGEPGTGTVDTVRQEITVAGLTGRLLPAVATPVRSTAPGWRTTRRAGR